MYLGTPRAREGRRHDLNCEIRPLWLGRVGGQPPIALPEPMGSAAAG